MEMRKWIGPGATVALLAVLGSSVAQTASSPSKSRKTDANAVSDAAPARESDGSFLGKAGADGIELPAGIAARLAQRGSKVAVMIELADEPAAVAYSRARSGAADVKGKPDSMAVAAARSRLATIERAQQAVLSALRATDAQVLYRVQRTYNGIAARVQMREIPQLRRLAGVKAVRALVPESLSNWNSVPFVGAPAAWVKGLGYTGQGIKVGVIDTGIDYLHANFGGPGFGADYRGLTPGMPATYDVFTTVGDDPNYPGVKVAGGYDFVGDAYDANAPDGDPRLTPQPDDDPMDCNGHGSHVAGTIGGYGVDDIGDTFPGPYGPGTDFASMIIGPGVAPKVSLYALRVFGCTGSTNVTVEAIDWAMDPNGDGDFSDHLDVINMSLGSNFGSEADPSAVASQNAALAGVLVAAASGNAGDVYYITSSPAAAPRAVSVAGSLDKAAVMSGLEVNSPPAMAGLYAASEAAFGPDLAVIGDVTGDLAVTTPTNGCTAISGVAPGQIALIARGTCSFKTKVNNAQTAGAAGVVITNSVPGFPITMGDDPTIPTPITIPAMMLSLSDGDAVRAAITGGATVNVTLTADHRERVKSIQPAVEDTVYSGTSRGAARLGTNLKPDVTSVAESVFSTEALSGTEGNSFTGTSMATPHIAGTMALLRQSHPTWTVEEIKALIMNTANHDVFLNIGPALPKIGPGRSGAGRQDIAAAINSNVVAYNGDGSGRVSVSFGAVEAATTLMLTKPIVVKNRGGSAMTYTVAFDGVNRPDIAGVTLGASTGSVSVAAGATATFNAVLNVDAALFKHSRDASVSNIQANGVGNTPRHFVSEKAGYITLTPATGPVLRVPVYAAVRPVAAMGTALSGFDISTGPNTGTRTVTLSGTPVNTGSSFSITSPFPGQDEVSLVSAFELQEKSPELVPGAGIDDSADLRYVGVGKTAAGATGLINFGIATYGNWSTASPNDTEFDIYIDADRDGNDDFVLFNWDLGSATGAGTQDTFASVAVNLNTGTAFLGNFVNGLTAAQRDTVAFNNRVINLAVPATTVGVTGAFDYQIFSFTREEGLVDASDRHTWNYTTPGLSAPGGATFAPVGAPVYNDLPAGTITVGYDRAAYTAAGSLGLLLLHHHNASPNQAQVLDVASVPQAKGDFDGDGKLDILWRNQGAGSGELAVWFMDGATRLGASLLNPPAFPFPSWEIQGQGDFDGDGDVDILWRNQGSPSGDLAVWFMNGVNRTGAAALSPPAFPIPSWRIVGVGDFNADGKPDILWRDEGNTGQIAIWYMNGITRTSATLINPSGFGLLNWKIVGVADFNGDGKPDILWRNTTGSGDLAVWYMNGANRIGAASLNPATFPILSWEIQAVGDLNGDGKPDIVWRNQGGAGELAIWFMDGVNRTSAAATSPPSFPVMSWRIVGPK